MKTTRIIFIFCLLILGNLATSQNSNLPDADIYTLEGIKVNASGIAGNDRLTVVLFWNINDLKSLDQLYATNEANNQLNGKSVKIIGICTDVPGYMQFIKPYVFGHNIGIDIYIDKNNHLKRAMSVPITPYTFLFDQKNDIQAIVMGSCDNISEVIEDMLGNDLTTTKDGSKSEN
jgi:hypothetical protein